MSRAGRRETVLWMAALNVTSEPPFNPRRYADLFQLIRDKVPAPIGHFGQERLTLYRFVQSGKAIEGSFGRYTYIDPDSPWWDSRERKALVDAKGHPLPQVRSGIGPNFKEVPFLFFLTSHILIFDTKSITPRQFFKGAQGIFTDMSVQQEFGTINLTVFPETDALDKILALQRVRKIKIFLTIPNPDQISELEEEFLERLLGMGAGKTEQKYVSQQGEEIVPDKELEAVMSLASRNGYVESTGQDSYGKTSTRSTREYPWKERVLLEEGESREEALRKWGRWFAEKIRSRAPR